jgi:D-alanine-D-alanine ligase
MEGRKRIRLGLLFGGRSGEHEVSVTSAASVIDALNPEQFEIVAIGITKSGSLASAPETQAMLPAHLHGRISSFEAISPGAPRLNLLPRGNDHNGAGTANPEIIFPLLHGPYGEDGTVQGLLELTGLPYIGCGVLASSVGMDKDVMKRLFLQDGLPVLPFRVLKSRDLAGPRFNNIQRELERDLSYPMFSKPANLGSSVGVVKVHDARQFADAVRYSAQFDKKVVVEKGIDARELECAILGNDDPSASGVGEVIPSREFYDYKAKYDDPDSRVEIPARIAEKDSDEVRRIAIRAFKCIEGSGLARVDFLLEKKTGTIWLNEINTMPGFTPISMYPKLWEACGVPFEELVRKLIDLGLERCSERSHYRISGEP